MHSLLDPFCKYISKGPVDTASWSFKLICRFNVCMLVCFVGFLSAQQYFGDPIDCILHRDSPISKQSMDSYCWIMGVYTQSGFRGTLTKDVKVSGWQSPKYSPTAEKHYLLYYQWIAFVMLMMAMTYAIPYLLWKRFEGGRLGGICEGLNTPIHAKCWNADKRSDLISYFQAGRSSEDHYWYAVKYFICQVLALAVCTGNIWLIDTIFDGFFVKYMPAITSLYDFNYESYTTHTSSLFPRMAKCEYHLYGASGSSQTIDALCMLPLNVLNEKLFTFLYIWLIFLLIVSALDVVHGIIFAVSRYCRVKKLAALTITGNFADALYATDNGRRGDFFMLYMIGKNMYPYAFSDLITELAIVRRTGGLRKDVEN